MSDLSEMLTTFDIQIYNNVLSSLLSSYDFCYFVIIRKILIIEI